MAYNQGGYGGYPPPQGGGYGAPPPQGGGYGAPPPQGGGYGGYGGGYGGGYNVPPPGQGGYGQGGYGGYNPGMQLPPAQGGYGAAPTQGGYGGGYAQPGYGYPPTGAGMQPMKPMGMEYEIHLRASHLDRKDVFSKSDPFVILSAPKGMAAFKTHKKNKKGKGKGKSKSNKSGFNPADWTPIHKTETIKNNHNPTWRPFKVNLGQLCKNNLDTKFRVDVYDYDPNGAHDLIGSVSTSIREMQVMKELPLTNPKRFGFTSKAGLLHVIKCSPVKAPVTGNPPPTGAPQQQQQQQQGGAGYNPGMTGGYNPGMTGGAPGYNPNTTGGYPPPQY